MDAGGVHNAEFSRMVRNLRRARRALINTAVALGPDALESPFDESGWTVRRLIEYCRATERLYFSRMYHFFNADVELYDSPAASLDHIAPADRNMSLAAECSQVWLAGRETEMWLDLITSVDLEAPLPAGEELPQGGCSIRETFQRVTSLYREKTKALKRL